MCLTIFKFFFRGLLSSWNNSKVQNNIKLNWRDSWEKQPLGFLLDYSNPLHSIQNPCWVQRIWVIQQKSQELFFSTVSPTQLDIILDLELLFGYFYIKLMIFEYASKEDNYLLFFFISEVYYRAGITPKQYQVELERQLRKTTLGISVGLLKSFAPNTKSMFDPYGHFGQTFQQIGEANNNINQYKICEVKPPSIEKVGSRLEL